MKPIRFGSVSTALLVNTLLYVCIWVRFEIDLLPDARDGRFFPFGQPILQGSITAQHTKKHDWRKFRDPPFQSQLVTLHQQTITSDF